MKKRILSAILAILLVPVYLFPVNGSAAEETSSEIREMLLAFNVYDASAPKGETAVTRAEFIKYAVKMSGQKPVKQSKADSPFSDVSSSTHCAEYIDMAYRMELVNGDDGGRFRPEDEISFYEAIVILDKLLGYDEIALSSGGYPSGYLKLAEKLKLLKNISYQETLDGALMEKLIFNALHVQTAEYKSITNDSVTFDMQSGKTLLSECFDIYFEEGLAEGNRYTTLLEPEVRENDVLIIGGKEYLLANKAQSDFIGKSIEVYYRYDDTADRRQAVYITASDKIKTVMLRSEDITGADAKRIEYTEGNSQRTKTKTIGADAVLLYNGKQTSLRGELLMPKHGNVELIDNDADGKIDVVKSWDYTARVASYVSTANYSVYDSIGEETFEYDENSSEYDVCIIKNGENVSFSAIRTGDVISEATSNEGEKPLKTLIVNTGTVSGSVADIDAEEMRVTLDDGSSFEYVGKKQLSLGTNGIFYVDFMNAIVYCDEGERIVYGYLYSVTVDEITEKINLRIFTENAHHVKLEVKEKIKFNGTGRTKLTSCLLESGLVNENGKVIPQLITYLVDGNNEVSCLNVAEVLPQEKYWSSYERSLIDRDVFRLSRSGANLKYWSRNKALSFSDKIACSEQTRIFIIPSDDENDYYITTAGALTDNVKYAQVYGYDVSECGIANAVVIKDDVQEETGYMCVNSKKSTLNSDDEETYVLSGLIGGASRSLMVRSKALAEGISKGDVISYSLGNDGMIYSIAMIYDYDGKNTERIVSGAIDSSKAMIYGTVKGINPAKNLIVVDYAKDIGIFDISKVESALYVYDSDENKYSKGTVGDIAAGDHVFMQSSYMGLKMLIVLKD